MLVILLVAIAIILVVLAVAFIIGMVGVKKSADGGIDKSELNKKSKSGLSTISHDNSAYEVDVHFDKAEKFLDNKNIKNFSYEKVLLHNINDVKEPENDRNK